MNYGSLIKIPDFLGFRPMKIARRNSKRTRREQQYKIPHKSPDDLLYIEEFLIGTTNNRLPEAWEFSTIISRPDDNETLLLAFNNGTVITHVNVYLNVDKTLIKDIISSKIFTITYKIKDDDFYLLLYFTNLPLKNFNTKIGSCMKMVFSLLFNITADESEGDENNDHSQSDEGVTALYNEIIALKKDTSSYPSFGKIPNLKPTLRKYQEAAICWMLFREQTSSQITEMPHPLFKEVSLKSGRIVYFNIFTGEVEVSQPIVKVSNNGGILADEMGLGKTVEVLACILLHRKQLPASPTLPIVDAANSSVILDSPSRPQAKKRVSMYASNTNIASTKRIKVPNDWVKPSSNKTQLQIALQMWYESKLSEVVSRPSDTSSHNKSAVECICGETVEKDIVTCTDCQKKQHAHCLGYNASFGEYRCPRCWMTQPLVETGATLIVCPLSLRKQWSKELCRHLTGEFRVLLYNGFSVTPVYPLKLKEYDIVVTTYSVLHSELKLTNSESNLALRHQKKYALPGSPLTCVKWWRLCLDEAQIADSPSSMVSAMAQKLTANFRWAVTGTPISNGISDLYGLISYLQIKPFEDYEIWKYFLCQPYLKGQKSQMCDFLREIIWRSSKKDVINQIDIPAQTIEENWLEFSATEKYFYKREHELSCNAFLTKASTYDPDTTISSLNNAAFNNVMTPLLYIRQACTYANTARGRYLATKKQVSSVEDLLDALVLKTTTECEESLRIVISAVNGLAGIYLLLQDPLKASSEYRKVLQLAARFSENEKEIKLSVDKLQLIHTLYNLADILDSHSNIPPSCRDANLRSDSQKLEELYIEKFINQSVVAYKESTSTSLTVSKLRDKFILSPGQWFADLLEWVSIGGYFNELLTRIRNVHETANVEFTLDLTSERYILYLIATWDDVISERRQKLIDKMNTLYWLAQEEDIKIVIDKEVVRKVVDCHLKPQKKVKQKNKCAVCVANDCLKTYECKLFSMQKRTELFEEMSLKGSWKPTSEELVLKSLLALGKSKSVNPDVIKDGETHLKLLDTLKKEFKDIRKFWTFLDQQICAQDEVDMCKIRLTLKEPNAEQNEKKDPAKDILKQLSYVLENKLENMHMMNEHELEYQRSVLQSEERQAMNGLEKTLGILSYLSTLRKQQYEGQKPDPCPICKNILENHWSILPCGHSFCLECINLLLEGKIGTKGNSIQCSVCREKQKICDISYIKADSVVEAEDNFNIVGHYSTKIEAIVKLILKQKAVDPTVKILVFSYWTTVLKYLKTALEKNYVVCEAVTSENSEKQTEKFKTKKEVSVLLLPIKLGGKGLNLIEATHVIMVEPQLSLADELQAVGRVHRIGQTKPTFVHKFFIKNTIEENVHHAVRTNADWDKNKITIGWLKNLFINTDESINDSNMVNEIMEDLIET